MVPATIDDVARVAEVSKSTVSRVLNGSGYVSAALRLSVERAITELSYRPNAFARLRSHDLRSVHVVVDDLTDEFVARVINGVVAEAEGLRIAVLVSSNAGTIDDGSPAARHRLSSNGSILIRGAPTRNVTIGTTDAAPMTVIVGDDPPGVRGAAIVVDPRPAAHAILRRVISAGHRRLAIVGATDGRSSSEELLSGLLEGATIAGLDAGSITMVAVESSESGGCVAADGLLGRTGLAVTDRVTALLCLDDRIAIGVMKRSRALGWDVPRDVAVTGFGATTASRATSPSLVSAWLPAELMGAAAVRALMDGSPSEVGTAHYFAAQITDGESIQSPRSSTRESMGTAQATSRFGVIA